MAFEIKNLADAAFGPQAEVDNVDVDILVQGIKGEGVVTGCAVTAQSTPDMTLAVAAGTVRIAGSDVAVTGANVTVTAADASNPRFDLVVVDDTGAKSVVAGTAAGTPEFPEVPADSVALAAVYVPAGDTAVESNQLTDKRVIVSSASGGGSGISPTLFDANTILKADSDDTPVALSVAASRVVGRKSTGGIAALTAAEVVEIVRTALPVELGIAVSDETTAITTGTAKVTFRMPFAMTVTGVRASLSTASTSGTPTVDINEAGVSILSTKLTIDANEKTSTTAATPAVISDSALADDAEITIDIDVAGTGAKGLKVWLIGTRA